jgi:hypothetical protein
LKLAVHLGVRVNKDSRQIIFRMIEITRTEKSATHASFLSLRPVMQGVRFQNGKE